MENSNTHAEQQPLRRTDNKDNDSINSRDTGIQTGANTPYRTSSDVSHVQKPTKLTAPRRSWGIRTCWGNVKIFRWLSAALAVIGVILGILGIVYALSSGKCPTCPDNWLRVNQTCFYFSDTESNWTTSRSSCLSQDATLAILTDTNIKKVIKRYKDSLYYWIGLSKNSKGEWLWLDDTDLVDEMVEDDATGRDCAFLNSRYGALDCSTRRPWICVKRLD
ncbi:C-type lectin domain family 2 member B-like isoform 2-T2 [Discoglossus pictus]